jgi:HK97 family phage prohead protease
MEQIRKAFSVVSKAVDVEAGIFEAMISTEAVDRQGDIVRATGAQLGNYLKNPVVLWAHDYSQPPVARALSVEIVPGEGIKATFQFPEWGSNPQADVVRRLWQAGFLNATSIGFIPLKSRPVDGEKDEDFWWTPQEYLSWELLEFSIVPVPANQEALRLAVKTLKSITKADGLYMQMPPNTEYARRPDIQVSSGNDPASTLTLTFSKQPGSPVEPVGEANSESSNTDAPSSDANEDELAQSLSVYFDTLKGSLK